MKTVEEFIKEIKDSETLKNELEAIKDKDALAEFLKKHDVDMTTVEGEISDNNAAAAAGGIDWQRFIDDMKRHGIKPWLPS